MNTSFDILILGGGTAGITAAAQFLRRKPDLNIAIIEPSDTHYYQPAWTLVGAGTYSYEKTARPMADLIPRKARWIRDYAESFEPEAKRVRTRNGQSYTYEYLVVAPGLEYNLDLVPGLEEALRQGSACSIYIDPRKAWNMIRGFQGGTALFTQPTTPIKCGGAPQKIMYLAESYFRKNKVRNNSNVVFATPGSVIFGIPQIRETLMKVVDRKDINLRFGYQLKKIESQRRIAWFSFSGPVREHNHKELDTVKEGTLTGIRYDFLHTAPPSVAPPFIRESVLAAENGWLDVDPYSLQHRRYPEIFGLGDVANLPTAKTGAAVRKQVPVVVDNILLLMQGNKPGRKSYNGYSSCPLITDYGKMVLAEFDYENHFTPDPKLKRLLISDSSKELWRLWLLKKYGLPYLYWNKMLKGKEV